MIIRSRRVVTPLMTRPATIHIDGERISKIGEYDDAAPYAGESAVAPQIRDYDDLTILPGIVDSHVHVNEPGHTEWEGFVTATRAAAAGGVTTLVDMPLNSIPATTSVAALMAKAEAMEGKCSIDVGLWGGAVPGNARLLREMLHAGALGFKCFLVDTGVAEFGHLDAEGLEEALDALRDTGAPLLVHAELPGPIEAARAWLDGNARTYRRYLASRPCTAEDQAIELVYDRCAKSGARGHVVHLSSSGGLQWIRRARDARVPLTAETTPHYLHFEAETIPNGATEFKCAPPIRERDNREQLWSGVREGLLQAIVSDHSPCIPEMKRLGEGDFDRAWGGIASLQFGLPIIWSEARQRGIGFEMISRLMSEGPAEIAGIAGRKGKLAAGYDADLVVFAPDETFKIEPDNVHHRHKVTPYAGEELCGVVKATYVRGVKVWDGRQHLGRPAGRWIRK